MAPPRETSPPDRAVLEDKLEAEVLKPLEHFVAKFPEAEDARFAVAVLFAAAKRIGLSRLAADVTAETLETTAALLRKHGKKK